LVIGAAVARCDCCDGGAEVTAFNIEQRDAMLAPIALDPD